jgi:uncharacterized protein with PIN domain
MLGFDAEYMTSWDESLVARALEEGRMVLTRKTALTGLPGIMVIAHDRTPDQLKELAGTMGLKTRTRPFTRCNLCNKSLISISRDRARGLVPEYVFATQDVFASCPSCGRVYWKGTHYSRACDMMDSLLREL